MEHAVIDMGSNACRLLWGSVKECQLRDTELVLRITRLGGGIGQTPPILTEEAIGRTLEVLAEYDEMLRVRGIKEISLLGTEALRKAVNRQELLQKIQEKWGWQVEVLAGEREARLSFLGARSALGEGEAIAVIDIGGGSSEIVSQKGVALIAHSASVGSVRLLNQPQKQADIVAALRIGWKMTTLHSQTNLVAVGGTATAAAMILTQKNALEERGCWLRAAELANQIERIEKMSLSERLSLPGMIPGREDVLPWGLRILLAAMQVLGQEKVLACPRDLMHGFLLEKAGALKE